MTTEPEPNHLVMNLVLSLTQYCFSIWSAFSAFGRHTFHPRPCLPAGRHRMGFSGTILINLTSTRLSHEGSSFRDPFDGQVQTILSCLLQRGVCKEATSLTKRRLPSMRSMLFFRFCLPHVDATRTLPHL